MDKLLIFTYGLALLILFCWYFFTDKERVKRIVGSVLTVGVSALALYYCVPPFDQFDANGKLVQAGKIPLGIDLKGGTSFLIQLTPLEQKRADGTVSSRDITPALVEQAIETIRKRVDSMGTAEPLIAPAQGNRILVQLPGLDPARIESYRVALKKVAYLEFRLVHPQSGQIASRVASGDEVLEPGWELKTQKIRKSKLADQANQGATNEGDTVEVPIIVRDSADIPGTMVSGAGATFGPKGWEIALEFGEEGAKLFGDLTAQNVGRQFAIILDGEVYSAPVIQDAILSGRASISGTFTQKEASDLASVLENPLQAGVTILNESNTSASLGSDAIRSGLSAGLIGALLTIVLVTIYYRLAGIVANIALVVFVILLFGAMGMFSSVLTLPGIAGVLLTLGMAIDANVLIYERFREERALGKSLATSIEAAYEKAFSAIFDSNLTTLITALILYVKATGPVRGFAVALVIGVVASMFSALLASRNLFAWGLKMGWIKDIKMASLIGATKFDFMGKARLSTAVSVLVIVGSLGYVAYRGEANFGVDFKGGDRLVLVSEGSKFETLDPIRNALSEVKMADGSIKDYSDATVQTEQSAGAEYVVVLGPEGSASAISSHLTAKFPEAKFRVAGSEAVGSLVGRELAFSSFVALTLGMLAILVYVAVRFEFSFAVGAVVALLHDVIITLGVFSILHKELSLVIVGAILTIAGYSVNDTIVVYDRIREGFKNGASGSNSDIMNRSINETLSRTILTGGVTLLTTLVLYFLGGPVLGDFALVMLIGVIVGTYSSIFIASPIVLWWSSLGGRDLKTEIKKAEEASRATA